MTVIDEYLAGLSSPEKEILEHMYAIVRAEVPDASEEIYYAAPSFKYKGEGLIAIVVQKKFISLYPFCGLERLGIDFSGFETTSGSLHFTAEKPVLDGLLRQIIAARVSLITA